MADLHFISGLPRSGSTLLSALLRQNPRFHASMSGPVAGMVGTMLSEMSARNEFSVFIDDGQRERVIRGLVDNFYADVEQPVIFDTSRGWCARMGLIQEMFPESRVIACVRHMPWVIDSIERLIQKNIYQPSSIFKFQTGGTVYSRAEGVASGDGMVGYAFNALKEAYFGPHAAGRLMLVQYESLVQDPARTLAAIYDFIGEQPFEHDFEHIDFDAESFDRKAGTPGLHSVRPKVQAEQRETVLPPDVFRRFESDSFWRDPQALRPGIPVV